MRGKNDQLIKLTNWIEVAVAVILIVAIFVAGVEVLLSMCSDIAVGDFSLDKFLETVLTIVVGIEFAKMLILHTPDSVLEVLLYAVARQIVIYHDSALENLIGVLAVAVIFIIRKYLCNVKVEEE